GIGRKLQLLRAVSASAPQTALRVGPGDPLPVPGIIDAIGQREKVVLRNELPSLTGIAKQLRLCIEPQEEDTVSVPSRERSLVAKGAVRHLDRSGCRLAAQPPQIVATIAPGLEDEVSAIGGPGAAAVRAWIAPLWQNRMC